MKRILIIALSLGVCVTMIVAAMKRRDQLTALRTERTQMLARLAAPVDVSLSDAPDNDRNGGQILPSPSMELLQLRAEVARLGNRKRELGNVSAESERLQDQMSPRITNTLGAFVLPAGYIKRSDAKFAGYNSPEETIQSLLWAIQNRNTAKFLEALDSEQAKQFEARMQSRDSIEEFFKESDSLPGMHIVGKEVTANGEVALTVEIIPGEETRMAISFNQIGGQWKIVRGF